MALEKNVVVDKIEVLESGAVQVRVKDRHPRRRRTDQRHIPPSRCRPRR
jgi:hypothetical protein